MEDTDYTWRAVTVVGQTELATRFDYESSEAWVARSLIFPDDCDTVDCAKTGDEIEVGIADWKVRELGWDY